MLLEQTQHPVSLFVTLTYDDEHLPEGGTLLPKHLKDFLKRLRYYEQLDGRKVRYFAVGEYGDKSWRPHYHIALFGSFIVGQDHQGNKTVQNISKAWQYGFIHIGEMNSATAGYITAYTLKGMLKNDDERLQGKHPEFCRMSRNPGIGATALHSIASNLFTRRGAAFLAAKGDAPTQVAISGKNYALGRYLSSRLRSELGRDTGCPSAVQLAISAKRLSVSNDVRASIRKQHATIAKQKFNQRRSKRGL